ncbi:MAG: DUF2284 domain-containing protein [Candidatus Heritagella sp.]
MEDSVLMDAVLSGGAHKAAVIDGSQIVLSSEFRKICESNQCGGYGQCWMCPPDIGDITLLMDKVRHYAKALVYQTIAPLEDSYDIEGMFAAGSRHAQISQRIQAAVRPLLPASFLHLSCGGCHLCSRCAKRDQLPCRFPEKALSSLEGYGIDVYNTVKNTDLKYCNGENTVTYFGMILFSEEMYEHPDSMAERPYPGT